MWGKSGFSNVHEAKQLVARSAHFQGKPVLHVPAYGLIFGGGGRGGGLLMEEISDLRFRGLNFARPSF